MKKLTLSFLLSATVAALVLFGADDPKPLNLAPYFPTPTPVVKAMLELGELKAGELVYDLGSGDGRIVIMAAQEFGAKAIGFEIDPKLVYQSRERIKKRKLDALATIEQQDLMQADFSKPDLITVYLLPASNDTIQPLLEDQMKAGARVISHDFTFRGWEIEKEITVEDPNDEDIPFHKLFLYRR